MSTLNCTMGTRARMCVDLQNRDVYFFKLHLKKRPNESRPALFSRKSLVTIMNSVYNKDTDNYT